MSPIAALAAALLLADAAAPSAKPEQDGVPKLAVVAPSARPAATVVDAFHAALRRGESGAAAALMADDALIFESGVADRSKADYARHHLPADAAFSRAVSSTVVSRAGGSDGTTAWIASEGRTAGTYKGKPLDLVTTETMVLRRVGKAWKIVHIHWSSDKRR